MSKETVKAPAQPQVQPKKFEVSDAGIQEIVAVINELVTGKYGKQTIFNVMNAHIKPVAIPVGVKAPAKTTRSKVRPIKK